MFNPYNCSEIFDVSPTITANCGSTTSSAAVLITNLGDEEMNKSGIIVLGNYSPSGHDASRIVDENGVAPTVKENHGTVTAVATEGNNEMINDDVQIIREEPLQRVGWHRNAKKVLSVDGLCRTLSTQSNNLATKIKEKETMRIRKLTPKECWRLMGFDDEDFYKAEAVNSNSQLYKQAGNSIVVDVLEAIFTNLKSYLSERK